MSHPHAPAIVTPGGFTVTLTASDGHPDRFKVAMGIPAAAYWRYTLDELGRVARIDCAASPGLWTPHAIYPRGEV